MDNDTFDAICKEMTAVVAAMTPATHMIHDLQVGMAFGRILNDYEWDWRYENIPSNEIQAVKDAEADEGNILVKVPFFLSEWGDHSMFISSEEENKKFVDAYQKLLGALAIFLPDHPCTARLQRWVMSKFNRETQSFKYDA